MRIPNIFCVLVLCFALASCSSQRLSTSKITYQSVRLVNPKNPEGAKDAEIALNFSINSNGTLRGTVYNLTDEIMIIDQTLSFFIDSDGKSISFYDPTIKTQTVTDINSGTTGASVNLGAIGSALGVRGGLGSLLNGINVGGSSTNGQAVANTTYIADQPRVSIGPKGSGALSKAYGITGIGTTALEKTQTCNFNYSSAALSPVRFSVCITYSLDGGETFKKITTDMYMNSQIVLPVSDSRYINETLRSLYASKRDAINEPWWILYIPNNVVENVALDDYAQGILIDYQ